MKLEELDRVQHKRREYGYAREMLEKYGALNSVGLYFNGSSSLQAGRTLLGKLKTVMLVTQLAECYRALSELEALGIDCAGERERLCEIADEGVADV